MMKRLLNLLIITAAMFSIPLYGQNSLVQTQELIFPQLVVGGGWECDLTLIAQGSDDSSGHIVFLKQDGSPFSISVNGGTAKSEIPYSMLYRSAKTFRLTKTGDAAVGFIAITQMMAENSDRGAISGLLTYRYREGTKVIMQIGVPASIPLRGAHVPFDNTGGNRTALAIASWSQEKIGFSVYDEEGKYQKTHWIYFTNSMQTAKYLDEIATETRNKRGFLTMASNAEFGLLVLNNNGPTLSTSAAFPAVYERFLVIEADGRTDWFLRVIRDGDYLKGIVESRMAGYEELVLHAVGALVGDTLQLSLCGLDSSGESMTITLAGETRGALDIDNGSVVVIEQSGAVLAKGSFDLYSAMHAPF